jgi:hypothetical protein
VTPDGVRCSRCGTRLADAPRFVELWGLLQHLDAVLAAWAGDPVPLATLLPERPVFLTDLTPPAPRAGDSAALRAQLEALARGDWREVLAAPGDGAATGSRDPRADAARAIAFERTGDAPAAILAWSAVLAAGEDERARLARGSLLARAGQLDEAAADLERAGDAFAARWSRAALRVMTTLHESESGFDAAALAVARAEAGAPSAYWSDPTVGRLLWSLLVSRAQRGDANARTLLRAAEAQLEHDTFWDRALLLVGWVRVGTADEAERVAQPLARREARALALEPALAGAPMRDVARAVAETATAIEACEPSRAREALAGAIARKDLRRFRLPCARCGQGTIGVDEVLEDSADEA